VKLGILGGTFDPIHNGHIAAAEAAIECGGLDRVLFVPSAHPPHRPPSVASPQQRLEMCRLAVKGDERFEVSDLEVVRTGPSFTVDTMLALRSQRPSDELFLILGWDAARLFKAWREPTKVASLARIVVVGRPGLQSPEAGDLGPAGLDPSSVVLCLRPTPDIAGSALRTAIASGESISGRVPKAVAQYIMANRIYRG
jgi:nicotinate-nucleotide adenylyltransferase